MIFRRFAVSLAAASLATAPVAAWAAPQPVPATEEAEGSELRAALVLPALALLIPLLLVLLLTGGGDEPAISP